MGEIYFGGTIEERQAQAESFLRRINSDFYGDGRNGFMATMVRFVENFAAIEAERERQQRLRHQENSDKLDEMNSKISGRSLWWTIAGVMVACAALVVTVIGIMVAVRLSHTSDLQPIWNLTRLDVFMASTLDAISPLY